MRVLVIGANGRTGRLIVAAAVHAAHDVAGMIRRPDQAPTQRKMGAEPLYGDVTGDLTKVLAGRDAVVFAAGGSVGDDRNRVDDAGAVNAVRTAEDVGVRRFVLVSSRYADRPEQGPEFLRPALRAKGRSDAVLVTSNLDWTIVRPGGLTDDEPTGRVDLTRRSGPGRIARADVAAVTIAALTTPFTKGEAFDLTAGDTPIQTALAALGEQGTNTCE